MVDFGFFIGWVFQYCDDFFGVFGDVELIGKFVGDDLREGKWIVFVVYVFDWVDFYDVVCLKLLLGCFDFDDDDVVIVCCIIEISGVWEVVELIIVQCYDYVVVVFDDVEMIDVG